jgi:uncharacterized SAM-binding protein YcdF (DUF218 family)
MERENPPYDAIICLGKNWQRKRESRQSEVFYPSTDTARTAIACGEAYLAGEAPVIINSTGHTIENGPTEETAMRLQQRSVFSEAEIPDAAILGEGVSIDTAGNMKEVKNIAEQLGMKRLKVIAVKRQIPRAKKLAKNMRLTVDNFEATEDILTARAYDLRKPFREQVLETGDTLIENVFLKPLLRVDPEGEMLRKITRIIRR